jgi:hypothetical protein
MRRFVLPGFLLGTLLGIMLSYFYASARITVFDRTHEQGATKTAVPWGTLGDVLLVTGGLLALTCLYLAILRRVARRPKMVAIFVIIPLVVCPVLTGLVYQDELQDFQAARLDASLPIPTSALWTCSVFQAVNFALAVTLMAFAILSWVARWRQNRQSLSNI